jgi:hypothetical protein
VFETIRSLLFLKVLRQEGASRGRKTSQSVNVFQSPANGDCLVSLWLARVQVRIVDETGKRNLIAARNVEAKSAKN